MSVRAAVVYRSGEPIVIETLSLDDPGPRELRVRVAATGVCHSDLHVAEGAFPSRFPIVLGHETSGVVESVGADVRTLRPGDHVVCCISGFCGQCEPCVTGHLSICQDKGVDRPRGAKPRMVDGDGKAIHQMTGISGFSEAMIVSERSCVSIRRDMPLDLACVLGCAVLTGFGAVAHTAKVTPGSIVAVLGCGGVGLMIVNAARIAGAGRIVAIDRVPAKLDLARKMGASDVIEAKDNDLVAETMALTGGGVHFSFEAIGLKTTVETAFRMLRPGGACTVVGVAAMGAEFSIPAMDLLLERRLQGCYMGSNHFPLDIPRLIDFYMDGRLNLKTLVSRRLPLDDVDQAFAAMKSGEAARSVITFPGVVQV